MALKWSLRVFVSEGGGAVAASSECDMVNTVGIGDSRRLKKLRRAAEATGHAPEYICIILSAGAWISTKPHR